MKLIAHESLQAESQFYEKVVTELIQRNELESALKILENTTALCYIEPYNRATLLDTVIKYLIYLDSSNNEKINVPKYILKLKSIIFLC